MLYLRLNCTPTWSLVCRFLHKAVETALSLGKGRPACHSEHSEALQSLLRAVVFPTVAYAFRALWREARLVRQRFFGTNGLTSKPLTLTPISHLIFSEAFILFQHLQQLQVLAIKLGNLLSVELQKLSGWTQLRQTLVNRGEWRVKLLTRGTNISPVGWKTEKRKQRTWSILKKMILAYNLHLGIEDSHFGCNCNSYNITALYQWHINCVKDYPGI